MQETAWGFLLFINIVQEISKALILGLNSRY